MNILQVSTECPVAEQWRLLSKYSYPTNIRRFLNQRGFPTISDDNIELIAGSVRQGQAYFDAAATAPLDVSPLLLYYGATSLLTAVSALLTNSVPPIQNHGMLIPPGPAARLAEVQVLPRNAQRGALQVFSNILSNGCALVGSDSWSLGELIGSIPDLKHDFENHYEDLPYFTVPVEVIHTKEFVLERIRNVELQRYPNPEIAMRLVTDLKKAYLEPQYKPEFVILFQRRNGTDIGVYPITGRKHLSLAHTKRGKLISPHPIILMYMGLYVLGFLPRYWPSLWNPFVRSDTTGEKFIIEKFMAVCLRFLPNLVLNYLANQRIQFVNETEGTMDLTKTFNQDEIKAIVKDTIRGLRAAGEFQ